MKLWTIHDEKTIKELDKHGAFICSSEKSLHINDFGFKDSYDWLSDQMKKRLSVSYDNISYPVWAWHTFNSKQKIDKRVSYIRSLPEDTYIIYLDIDDSRILLSDFDTWHYVLNNIAYREDEYENTHISWSDSLTLEEKQKTWENIFDVRKSQIVQATFWKLEAKDIVKIEKLR